MMAMANEIWEDILGYEGFYQVSNMGRVRSLDRVTSNGKRRIGKILKTRLDKDGYEFLNLSINGKRRIHKVHRLVLETFNPTDDSSLEVNHINEIKDDNRLENLEWVTHKQNCNHGTRTQRQIDSRSQTIYQYTLDYELVYVWKNAVECMRETGYDNSFISKVCRGKKESAYGYIWSYEPLIPREMIEEMVQERIEIMELCEEVLALCI